MSVRPPIGKRSAVAAILLTACGSSAVISSAGDGGGPLDADAGTVDAATEDGGSPDANAKRTDAGSMPTCAPQMARTGEPLGTAIERDSFGCYGACGPSCTAECLDDSATVSTSFQTEDGGARCLTCSYTVKTCKSHAFCRWHDDCYRQCDLRWDAVHDAAPATPPDNPCYLSCDNIVVQASALCGEDWSQLTNSTPSIRDACWDGSFVSFSTLVAQRDVPGACGDTSDTRPRPWAPDLGDWDDFATPPTTLPEGYSCTNDTDCPDRNQYCDPDAGSIFGINGTNGCANISPPAGISVIPLPPTQTWVVDGGLPANASCNLGYECQSGSCKNGSCAVK